MQEAFRELMARHRNLKFVSVDSTKLETNLEKKLGLKPFDGSHQLVHFTRYNVTAKAKVSRVLTPARWWCSGALDEGLRCHGCGVIVGRYVLPQRNVTAKQHTHTTRAFRFHSTWVSFGNARGAGCPRMPVPAVGALFGTNKKVRFPLFVGEAVV